MEKRLTGGEGQLDSAITINTDALREYIDRAVRRNVKHQNKGERFAVWVNRAEEGDLT